MAVLLHLTAEALNLRISNKQGGTTGDHTNDDVVKRLVNDLVYCGEHDENQGG